MGKRGPRPTPTAELDRRGSWRGKTRSEEPKPADAVVGPPKWIGTYGRAMWRAHAAEMRRLGLLRTLDVRPFALACRAYHDYRTATKRLDGSGLMPEVRRALIAEQDKAWSRCVKLMREFGMTPASRPGLKGEIPKADDGKGRFFKVVG